MNESQNLSEGKDLMQETLEILQKTFSEKDNIERNKAEMKLKHLEMNILSHIKIILLSLTSDKINNSLKMSIILYLKNTLRNKLENKSLEKSEVVQIIETYIELILLGNLEDSLLQNLNLGLTILFNSSYLNEDEKLIVNICQFLVNFFQKECSDELRLLRCKPMIMLYQSVISSLCSNSDNILELISIQFQGIDLMIKFVISKLPDIDQNSQVYLNIIDVIRCIMDYFFLSLLKLKKLSVLDKAQNLYVNNYLPFAIQTLHYSLINENLISFTGMKDFDSHLNSMKSKSLQFICYLIQLEGSSIKNDLIIEHGSKIVKLAISTLENTISFKLGYIMEMHKGNIDSPDYNYDILLFHILLFLSRFLTREPILTQFTPYIKNFVLTIIFPLLLTGKRDIFRMKTDGLEHYTVSLDVQSEQKEKTYKSAASFMLTRICERFDGMTNFICNFALQLIDYCLNNSEVANLPKYVILNSNETGVKKILTDISPENQIDTSIQILLILKDFLAKSSNLMAILRLVIETQADKILLINSDIIKDKLSFLYGYFLDELYREDEVLNYYNLLFNIFNFLFVQIMNFHITPGLAYSASFALSQMIFYKGYADVSNNIIKKMMPQLISKITEIDVNLFFDVLLDIVLYLDVEDHLLLLCSNVTARLLKEIKSTKKSDEKDINIYVSKCFNILRSALEKTALLDAEINESVKINPQIMNVEEFEKIIEPIVVYLKKPEKINFDDEVVLLLISFMKCAKRITNLSLMIFPFLQMFQIKNEGMTDDLFELITLYIKFDIHNIFMEPQYCEVLLNIIKSAIQESDEDIFSPVLGSLLAQNWLQSKTNLPERLVEDLVVLSLNQMVEIYYLCKENFDELTLSFTVIPFTSYITTIFSAIINYPNQVFCLLMSFDKMTNLINCTDMMLLVEFFNSYQSKTIILGLCTLISNELVLKGSKDYLNKFLLLCFSFLVKQKNEESKGLKKVLKKEVDCNFVLSDEEDNAASDEEEESTYKRIKKMKKDYDKGDKEIYKEEKHLNKLTSKMGLFQNLDEYEIFNKCLLSINNFNDEIIPQWEESLNQMQKVIWKDLIHTRRIRVSFSGHKFEVPRRTVKIKRNNP